MTQHTSPQQDAFDFSTPMIDRTPPSAQAKSGIRIVKICEVCETPFQIIRTLAEAYHACSRTCSTTIRQGRMGGRKSCTCQECGKVFTLPASRVANGLGMFCSNPCRIVRLNRLPRTRATDLRSKHLTKRGYIRGVIWDEGAEKWRGIFEHTWVMEQHLGRKLTREERVHHKGTLYPISDLRNRTDNRIENLELYSSHGEHLHFAHAIPDTRPMREQVPIAPKKERQPKQPRRLSACLTLDLIKNPDDVARRLWDQVDKSGECWLWTSGVNQGGYGRLSLCLNGQYGPQLAHRISYVLEYGFVPAGLFVIHKCDEFYPAGDITYRKCCRPDHLDIGNDKDNVDDMYRNHRAGNRTYAKGHATGKTTLKDEDIRLMRRWYAEGDTYASLARCFGISQSQSRLIVLRQSWKHVDQGEVVGSSVGGSASTTD